MRDLLYIAGNQLFAIERLQSHRNAVVLMVEDPALCTRLPFHQQKLGFLLAAMRAHAGALRRSGFDVRYFALPDDGDPSPGVPTAAVSTQAALEQTIRATGARRLLHFDSEDRGLMRAIGGTAKRLGLRRDVLDSPMFLLDRATVDAYFAAARRPRMAGFYRAQRLRLNLLLDAEKKPLGGRWSFDADNRKSLPASQPVPELPAVRHAPATRQCLALVRKRFADHPGDAAQLWLPCDRSGALGWLDRFLEERLTGFGTYEDALSSRSPTLFHSTLAPFLNVGLLTPDEVVERALEAAHALKVPLNDLEGFLRQIVGWREFIRGAYRTHRRNMRRRNAWNGQRRLAPTWLAGETGLDPLDRAVCTANDYAWNHHIERLMIIANLMNLAGVHPGEAYRFFMTRYIDAYDWVMVPNVFGMGLTSDGGIFATKPYICGANYVRRMSDYPKGDWMDVMDGLYWRFVATHRKVLASNPRLAVMVRALTRIEPRRLRRILAAAESFIAAHTLPAA